MEVTSIRVNGGDVSEFFAPWPFFSFSLEGLSWLDVAHPSVNARIRNSDNGFVFRMEVLLDGF